MTLVAEIKHALAVDYQQQCYHTFFTMYELYSRDITQKCFDHQALGARD